MPQRRWISTQREVDKATEHASLDAPKPAPPDAEPESEPPDIIHQLLRNPVLYNPLRTPRNPIVLCHGIPRSFGLPEVPH